MNTCGHGKLVSEYCAACELLYSEKPRPLSPEERALVEAHERCDGDDLDTEGIRQVYWKVDCLVAAWKKENRA